MCPIFIPRVRYTQTENADPNSPFLFLLSLQGLKTRVCQNCAKITRTRNAYSTCCYNVNSAYGWCKRIYDFTNPLG